MFTLASYSPLLAEAAAVIDPWAQTLLGLDPEKRFALLVVAIGCGTGIIIAITGIISSAITSVHRRRAEMEFKRELLDRGMGADEIAKVVESTPPTDFLQRWAPPWGKCSKN